MNDEELKAIEETKERIVTIQEGLDKGYYYGERYNYEQELLREQTLLKLIEKQQKEIENSISKDKIREIIEKERYKTTSSYNDWKYDENVYKAEKNMINILEDALLKGE